MTLLRVSAINAAVSPCVDRSRNIFLRGVVPGAGLEPARHRWHRILSPARLPVPSSRQGIRRFHVQAKAGRPNEKQERKGANYPRNAPSQQVYGSPRHDATPGSVTHGCDDCAGRAGTFLSLAEQLLSCRAADGQNCGVGELALHRNGIEVFPDFIGRADANHIMLVHELCGDG